MRFRAVHKLMSYLLAGAAVGTLMTTGTVPLPTLALLLALGTLSWFVESGTWFGQFLDRAGLVINVFALAFFGLSLFQVIESFPEPELTPILNVVLFLLGYKLFHRRNNRDYLQVYILSFLLVLAAAWLAQTVFFVAGFLVYVVLATWTLILFHLRREIEDNYLVKHLPEAGSERVTAARVLNSRRVVGRPFFVWTGLMALGVFLGAAMIFAVIPRVGLGFLSGTFRRRVNIVGFSDQVTLGHHGVITGDNQTVVLWVKLPRLEVVPDEELRNRMLQELYWRGTVYDTYLDGRWVRSRAEQTETIIDERVASNGDSVYWISHPEAPPEAAGPRNEQLLRVLDRQEIHLVGLSTPVAFALDEPVAYRVPEPELGAFTRMQVKKRFGGEAALQVNRLYSRGRDTGLKDFSGGRYIAYSRQVIGRAPIGRGRTMGELLSEGRLENYLKVPASLSDRVEDLAREITRGKEGPMAKAIAIVEWLHKTHSYTTDLRRNPDIADPLEDFLFHQKAGHCEYFASAAAILLRLAGVPTRYINGFLGGEWNSLANTLTVRDNRAHAWVEIYLGPGGWMRLDATPPLPPTGSMGRIRQVIDSIEFVWSRWVIDYDVSRQIQIARRIGKTVGVDRKGLQVGDLKKAARWGFGGLLVVVAVVLLLRKLRLRWKGRLPVRAAAKRRRSGPPVYKLYEKASQRLSRRGWTRGPAETPREFAHRLVAAEIPGAPAMTELSEYYAAARFGDREVPPERLEALEDALEELADAPAPISVVQPQQQPSPADRPQA